MPAPRRTTWDPRAAIAATEPTDGLALAKYVGSKLWLLAARPDRFPLPDPNGAVAVPFLGGGSVAAHYGARGIRVVASDINPRLVNAHREVQRDDQAVAYGLDMIVEGWRAKLTALPPEERDTAGRLFFEGVRAKLDEGEPWFQAARFLFVIRAGFNGLWRENGDGVCNVAYGKPKLTRDLVGAEGLRAYAAAIRGVELHHEDFAITCARARPGWASYLDAPYSGTFTDYCGGDWEDPPPALPGLGKPSDRERLAAMLVYLDAIGVRCTWSDAITQATQRLFARWPVEVVSRKGTVSCDGAARDDVAEGLWTNGWGR